MEITKIKPTFIELTSVDNEEEIKFYTNIQYIGNIYENKHINKTVLVFSNGHVTYVKETPERIIDLIKFYS